MYTYIIKSVVVTSAEIRRHVVTGSYDLCRPGIRWGMEGTRAGNSFDEKNRTTELYRRENIKYPQIVYTYTNSSWTEKKGQTDVVAVVSGPSIIIIIIINNKTRTNNNTTYMCTMKIDIKSIPRPQCTPRPGHDCETHYPLRVRPSVTHTHTRAYTHTDTHNNNNNIIISKPLACLTCREHPSRTNQLVKLLVKE